MRCHDLDHARKVASDHLGHLPWRQPLGQGGEPADVGEHDGGLQLLPQRQRRWRGLDQLGDLGWQEGGEHPGEQRPFLHALEAKAESGLGGQVGDQLLAGDGERLSGRSRHGQRPE
jgi:hypothetical protein